MKRFTLSVFAALAAAGCAGGYDVREKSILTLQADMTRGKVTAEALVRAYEGRIARVDRAGPRLRAVIALNPDAIAQARALDAERRNGHVRGPLHGVPVLVKDNIETADPIPTTAGSLALAANQASVDAPAIARLRAAGAIILGKTNLSEWANIRSNASISGWSAVGGLTRNPYALDRNACGSSSGSGAATAASLAAAAVGTETDGSVTCPAAINGLVGVKPTVGLVSRSGVVPISHSQDTPGPMARSVEDAALLLTVLAGADSADPATATADAHKVDYAAALDAGALRGKRIGVLRFLAGFHRDVDVVFEAALARLKASGAELVEIDKFEDLSGVGDAELTVLLTELKVDLNAYLARTPSTVTTRTLSDLIAFNNAHPAELALFGQDLFVRAQATGGLGDGAYLAAAAKARRLAGADGIDRMLAAHKLDALIAPTGGPAWTTDIINGDHALGDASTLPAVAGYPHVTVPMGDVKGLPVGLSFIGGAWSDARMMSMAYAFEQSAHARKPPRYLRSIDLP